MYCVPWPYKCFSVHCGGGGGGYGGGWVLGGNSKRGWGGAGGLRFPLLCPFNP